MDRFIFKEHKDGILHVLGNGKTVFYDYDKIAAMKPGIDRYLAETPVPTHHKYQHTGDKTEPVKHNCLLCEQSSAKDHIIVVDDIGPGIERLDLQGVLKNCKTISIPFHHPLEEFILDLEKWADLEIFENEGAETFSRNGESTDYDSGIFEGRFTLAKILKERIVEIKKNTPIQSERSLLKKWLDQQIRIGENTITYAKNLSAVNKTSQRVEDLRFIRDTVLTEEGIKELRKEFAGEKDEG